MCRGTCISYSWVELDWTRQKIINYKIDYIYFLRNIVLFNSVRDFPFVKKTLLIPWKQKIINLKLFSFIRSDRFSKKMGQTGGILAKLDQIRSLFK